MRALDPSSAAAEPVASPSAGVRRRTVLVAGLASLVVAATGCRQIADDPTARDSFSARQLVKESPFFIGSRGGSRDWPELTAYGLEQAAGIPEIKAMEIWVCRTADGVLVCSSDPTTKRLMGRNYTILNQTWATLSTLKVTAKETLDPRQPAQPFARLDDILHRFVDRFIFFVEPRVSEATTNLMAMLNGLGRPERVVWKEPINSVRFDEAKQHGFSTWGYVLDEPAHSGRNLAALAKSDFVDMIGVSMQRPKSLIASVVAAAEQNQKPAIATNVNDPADLKHAIQAGCTGICSRSIREIVAAAKLQ